MKTRQSMSAIFSVSNYTWIPIEIAATIIQSIRSIVEKDEFQDFEVIVGGLKEMSCTAIKVYKNR